MAMGVMKRYELEKEGGWRIFYSSQPTSTRRCKRPRTETRNGVKW